MSKLIIFSLNSSGVAFKLVCRCPLVAGLQTKHLVHTCRGLSFLPGKRLLKNTKSDQGLSEAGLKTWSQIS